MSIERNLEMMDDYLANRLSDADRTSFEQMLESDPTLKNEFTPIGEQPMDMELYELHYEG